MYLVWLLNGKSKARREREKKERKVFSFGLPIFKIQGQRHMEGPLTFSFSSSMDGEGRGDGLGSWAKVLHLLFPLLKLNQAGRVFLTESLCLFFSFLIFKKRSFMHGSVSIKDNRVCKGIGLSA